MPLFLKLSRFIFFSICLPFFCLSKEYDLTIVGNVKNADGLGRIPITFIKMLGEDLKINHYWPTVYENSPDINAEVNAVLSNPDKTPAPVSLMVTPLWFKDHLLYTFVPESEIKIAYSMWESNQIPASWVQALNLHFDAVVVPDPFLVECYRHSGVIIPIFELPLALNLDGFLARPRRVKPHDPFVFGCMATACSNKNQILLIQAFAEVFGNSKDVILYLTSRLAVPGVLNEWEALIQTYGCSNIIYEVKEMSNNLYRETMASIDCYINISKGEGYSIGPREALALGIPCILTNNTAQKTLCSSGLVRPVLSEISIPPTPDWAAAFNNENIGNYMDCRLEDVKEALHDVYNHYGDYLEKSKKGPQWVSQYRAQNLKGKYLNLIKPKRVVLGDKNEITNEYLMTDSENLFNKYVKISRKNSDFP